MPCGLEPVDRPVQFAIHVAVVALAAERDDADACRRARRSRRAAASRGRPCARTRPDTRRSSRPLGVQPVVRLDRRRSRPSGPRSRIIARTPRRNCAHSSPIALMCAQVAALLVQHAGWSSGGPGPGSGRGTPRARRRSSVQSTSGRKWSGGYQAWPLSLRSSSSGVGRNSSPYFWPRWCRHDQVRKSAPLAPMASWARNGFGPTSRRRSLSIFQNGMLVRAVLAQTGERDAAEQHVEDERPVVARPAPG